MVDPASSDPYVISAALVDASKHEMAYWEKTRQEGRKTVWLEPLVLRTGDFPIAVRNKTGHPQGTPEPRRDGTFIVLAKDADPNEHEQPFRHLGVTHWLSAEQGSCYADDYPLVVRRKRGV